MATLTDERACELLYLTGRPREACRLARDWLLDCFDGDEAETIELLNQVGLVAAVERHYEGGWRAFLEAEGLLREEVIRAS